MEASAYFLENKCFNIWWFKKKFVTLWWKFGGTKVRRYGGTRRPIRGKVISHPQLDKLADHSLAEADPRTHATPKT